MAVFVHVRKLLLSGGIDRRAASVSLSGREGVPLLGVAVVRIMLLELNAVPH